MGEPHVIERGMTHEELIASPEAKRIARAIAEESWVSDFLEAADPIMRRIGSALAFQELQVRMGLIAEPFDPRVRYRDGKPGRPKRS